MSANLLFNSKLDPEWRDSSNRPYWWAFDSQFSSQAGNGICEVVNATGPGSVGTVPVFRCARDTAGSNAAGPMFTHQIFRTDSTDNAVFTRDRPTPTVGAQFPATMPFSIWSKGTNVANSNPDPSSALSARMVAYYVDATGFAVNVDFSDYHIPLGTVAGRGTWDWTQTTYALPIHSNASIVRLEMSLGLHDQEATGELLMYAPSFTT